MGELLNATQLMALDPDFWTPERVEQQLAMWNFHMPTDPTEREAYIQRAQTWEDVMRSLNTSLHMGDISGDEYIKQAWQAARQSHGDTT